MRYSKLFGKTTKSVPKDIESSRSYALLFQAGFLRESVAGRYFFLPLGLRVKDKIMQIIREEMNISGAQELLSPTLHPMDLWRESNRDAEAGFELMIVTDRRGKDFALGGTGEEMMVDLIRKFKLSYRDLPINMYQFSQKFRDELRVRGGLLRAREFMMKDAYSFDIDQESFQKEYQNMWETYEKIFKRVGLNPYVVPADNGYIGGESSHEFIEESSVGESVFFMSEDGTYLAHEDIATFQRTPHNPDEEIKGLEAIDQPEWVKTMEDNIKHYGDPAWRYLKNVVYKNSVTGEIFIAVIRGDLDVNKTKLEHLVDAVGQLEDATVEDLTSFGSKPGYVHSWGHSGVRYIGDLSLTSTKNFIGGQKEDSTDTRNVNYGRDFECELLADIALAKSSYLSESGSLLVEKRGIEIGNIFNIGYHYANKMHDVTFIDEQDTAQKYYMGSYGIGVGRTLATIVERYADDKGLVWPDTVAPYRVHLIVLGSQTEQAEALYSGLQEQGIEVLFDDRSGVSAGEKFADAGLIGCTYRVVVSDRSLQNGGVEIKRREIQESEIIPIDSLFSYVS